MAWSFRGLIGRHRERPAGTTLGMELGAAGLDLALWCEERRRHRHLFVDLAPEAIQRVQALWPRSVASTVEAAEAVLRHEFRLLGARFVPQDPDRAARTSGYRPIDWRIDPTTGLRFPAGFSRKEWDLDRMRPGTADIKLPWELARCQHWLPLGQAHRLTGAPRFALEIAEELDDFLEANPVGSGVQWTCTMDVSIRAANWALGLSLVRECEELPPEFWRRAYSAVFEHGVFVFANLEDKREVTSNHYLSNVVGLLYVASLFRGLPQADRWIEFCGRSLEREIVVQVLEDGADFESSIPYHRLVLELFLGGLRAAGDVGLTLSTRFRETLHKMAAFLLGVLRPDGLMPQVGDADDGRLQIASGYGTWNPQDGRHVLGVAGAMLGERDWLAWGGPEAGWEAAWWGLGTPRPDARTLPDSAQLFAGAGLAVVRSRGTYLLVSNGRVGTEGFGNHKHNDLLGFEFHAQGTPLVVDPGSHVYTGDPVSRNRFRSVASHSTLRVDGAEPNELRPEWLFRLFETARPVHLGFEAADGVASYAGRHEGYVGLEGRVVHERRFRLALDTAVLLIQDRLAGSGRHRLEWHFHLAPGVAVQPLRAGLVRLTAAGRRFVLLFPEELALCVRETAYSPSYGVLQPCAAVDFLLDAEPLPPELVFVLGPEEAASARERTEWARRREA